MSVLNDCVLRANPWEPRFPGRPWRWCIIKRSQDTSSSLMSYFSLFCSLMRDIRAYSSSPESHFKRLKSENEMPLAAILNILCPFSDPMLDRKHYFKNASSNCDCLKKINQDPNSISMFSNSHVWKSLLLRRMV